MCIIYKLCLKKSYNFVCLFVCLFGFFFIAEKVNKALEQHFGAKNNAVQVKAIQHCDSLDQPQ